MLLRTITAFLLAGAVLFAQPTKEQMQKILSFQEGSISGKVIDAASGAPIEYANVVLIKKMDGKIATGTVTDAQGQFLLDKLGANFYQVKVSYIGYVTLVKDSILLLPKKPDIALGTIALQPSGVQTKEVTVTGNKDVMTRNFDKKVINVEKDLTAVGGTALDALQNVPSVQVDADGTVSLRGSKNLTILVNGKPSGLSGVSSADVLTQIPSSQIESIEIVTNPSAKYDPEGTGGIINIILKKKLESGYNGMVSVNAGTGDKYNTSLSANYRRGNWNLFGSYDTRFNRFGMTNLSNRTNYLLSGTTFLNQNQKMTTSFNMHNIQGGIDFAPDDVNLFTVNFSGRVMDNTNKGYTDNTTTMPGGASSFFKRGSDADRGHSSYDYTLSYKRTFERKGEELTSDIMYSTTSMERTENNTSFAAGLNPLLTRSRSDNRNNMFMAQGNYVLPQWQDGKIESGFKGTIRRLTSNNDFDNYNSAAGQWLPDLLQKNYFTYDEQIYALYSTVSRGIGDFKAQLGLRAEQVYTKGALQTNGESFTNNYFSLYPSGFISYDFTPTHTLQLSFSRRVDRPNTRQLNPFVDASDSLNIVTGNPRLKAQFINSVELENSIMFGPLSLTATGFYRHTNDIISLVSILEQTGVTRNTFANVATGDNYGVELVGVQPLAKWWRLTANGSWFKSQVKGTSFNTSVDNGSSSWLVRVASSMTLFESLQFQLMGTYNSPSISMQGMGGFGPSFLLAKGKIKEMYGLDAALRQDFLEGKLSVTLRVSDILNSRKYDSEMAGDNFFMAGSRKPDSRIVFLGISYRLDKSPFKDKKRTEGESSDDF